MDAEQRGRAVQSTNAMTTTHYLIGHRLIDPSRMRACRIYLAARHPFLFLVLMAHPSAHSSTSTRNLHHLLMPFRLRQCLPCPVGHMGEILTNMRVPQVCIVGAGMAGLRCADLLLESGVQVSMFEARDRIGGRVSVSLLCKDRALTRRSVISRHFSDLKLICRFLMDLLTTLIDSSSGCNQIHGTDHDPFMKLAQETGTITYLPEDVHSIFLKDRKHLQGEEALKLWTAVEDLIREGVNFSRTSSANISEKTSLWN
jgi:NAD(P)-binding Rossmann-like domain